MNKTPRCSLASSGDVGLALGDEAFHTNSAVGRRSVVPSIREADPEFRTLWQLRGADVVTDIGCRCIDSTTGPDLLVAVDQ